MLLYALCHDLLEIITGDEETLHFTSDEHDIKHAKEREAILEFTKVFACYPSLRTATLEYEKLDTPEAATVFVLDKACAAWTYHAQGVVYAQDKGLHTVYDVERWTKCTKDKFKKRLNCEPPQVIVDIFEQSSQSLKDLVAGNEDA